MSIVERFHLQHIESPMGTIVVAQGEKDVPFVIRRIYYIHGVPEGTRRGFHAHKELTQIAVCVSGSCRFHLDNGLETAEVLLDDPHVGIVIRPMFWREMYDFSAGCVLLVLASQHHDESDYIRDYEEFKRVVATR